ncbi:MAG: translation elongation factor Ts [Pirellulales bacterium]|nr:translation elongation factor Ts [Pirellulales bacterium]
MSEISAAAVKAFRDKTGLPMMECKKALMEANGDEQAAIELLRKAGKKTMAARSDRETASGRLFVLADVAKKVGAMVELQCESAPVASNEEFIQLGNDLVTQLATGPGAATAEELLAQKSPSRAGTLQEQWDDLANKIREVFRLARLVRIQSPCGGYAHHSGDFGVLVEIEGGNQQVANEISMHVAAMRPMVVNKEDLPAEVVAKEREILLAAARQEGKPENILEKMVEGRLRVFYSERVLNEQPFVKDDKQTVGKYAGQNKAKVLRYVLWQLGKE